MKGCPEQLWVLRGWARRQAEREVGVHLQPAQHAISRPISKFVGWTCKLMGLESVAML